MWRALSKSEVQEIIKNRNPMVKIGRGILCFFMLLPIALGISNVVSLLEEFQAGTLIGLVFDVGLLIGLYVLQGKLNKIMGADVEQNELMACEVMIEAIRPTQYTARNYFPHYERNTVLACEVTVKTLGMPETEYHVRAQSSFEAMHRPGDRMILVCSGGEALEENMFLISGK